ncbi:MAG TPA: TolC family protein [Bryobacteraceae bacterium]|nr:TolC family protein [Bryobacteraceae bacterium]
MNNTPLCISLVALCAGAALQTVGAADLPPTYLPAPQILSLDDCLHTAMAKNHQRPASRFAVAAAEAQHRQALAAYWPQITAKGGWTELSNSPDFLFPASTMYIPAQNVSIPGGTVTVTVPANSFAPGFPPAAIQMPVNFPGQSFTTSAQAFPVPAQDVKLANPQNFEAAADFTWLLFDGGMRGGFRRQAQGAIEAAQADSRRTDLEITDSVVRLYWGAVLARRLRQIGDDTLAQMEVTLELTQSMYQNGAGKVNKTDYLENQVIVETIRSMVAELSKNQAQAEAALAYTMGLPWNATVRPADEELPYRPFAGDLGDLVATAYEFNPDWAKIEAGLKALEGAETTARSDYFPKIAFTGDLHRWWNSYNAGIATSNNKEGWSIGIGVEVPLFNGFLTKNKIAEARAQVNKLKEQKLLLREGIGLQLRELFLSLEAASKTYQAADKAMAAAREDRALTSRAYESELVETERVIRAQLFEALMAAQYQKARYDLAAVESQISLLVGKELAGRLNPHP